MRDDRHILADFLNHGMTPFVGRREELERILAFRRGTNEGERLRSALLLAEGGMGKSRLIEEVLMRVGSEGVIALHVKLLPEGANGIPGLIAHALQLNDVTRPLIRDDLRDDPIPVLSALRNVVRLRPTLLLFEDLHLVEDPEGSGMRTIVEGLADEPVSLLLAGRSLHPVLEGMVRGSLPERIELHGLGPESVDELWRRLFGHQPDPELIRLLSEASRGNPLALRSALRAAVVDGELVADEKGEFRPVAGLGRFARAVRRDASRIGEGMAASLDDPERRAAARLALLGEILARESALFLLSDTPHLIDRLIFRGILRILPTTHPPLPGKERERSVFPASDHPLIGFSHTLIHQHFLESSDVENETAVDLLSELLADDLPLYSHHPVLSFLRGVKESRGKGSTEYRYPALLRSSLILYERLLSPDWKNAGPMLTALKEAVGAVGHLLEPDQSDDLRLILLFREALLAGLEGERERDRELIHEAEKLTQGLQSEQVALFRLAAVIKDPDRDWYRAEVREEGLAEAERIAAKFPHLRFHAEYARFICTIGIFAWEGGDNGMARRIEEYYHELRSRREGESLIDEIDAWYLPVLAQIYETEEELSKRKEQLAALDHLRYTGIHATHLAEFRMRFYFDTGNVDALLRTVGESREMLRMRVMPEIAVRAEGRRLVAMAALGPDPARLIAEGKKILETLSEEEPRLHPILHDYLITGLWLAGHREWKSVRNDEEHAGGERLNPLLGALLEDRPPSNELLEQAASVLERSLLGLNDLISMTAAVALFEKYGKAKGRNHGNITRALTACRDWLNERDMPGFTSALILRAANHVEPKRLKVWKGELEASVERRRERLERIVGDNRIFLSMIGRIEVREPSGDERKISGARMKRVLGLIVAGRIAGSKPTLEEFALLAGGDELADIESVRNNLHVRLHGLRKVLGADALQVEAGYGPTLDERLVRVDLIELCELLDRANHALGRGSVGRALVSLREVLERVDRGVLFPGLFDAFFDAARDDFEIRLRDLVLRTARETFRLADDDNAVRLLEDAFARTPDDEEIAGLLCEGLERLGQRSRAEWVRRVLGRAVELG